MKNIVTSITILITTLFGGFAVPPLPPLEQLNLVQPADLKISAADTVLSTRSLSLANRHRATTVNEVFKKNILLNLAYLNGQVTSKANLNWDEVMKMKAFAITLKPGETFAYHDHVLEKYKPSLSLTTKSHFNANEGYLFSGFLYGDGVCHLASIINWAAQDAGLDVLVTKAHSIAKIPDVPDEYGVSIYTIAGEPNSGVNNNLYITNNKTTTIEIRFTYENEVLTVKVVEIGNLA